jgi:hypothetical protein
MVHDLSPSAVSDDPGGPCERYRGATEPQLSRDMGSRSRRVPEIGQRVPRRSHGFTGVQLASWLRRFAPFPARASPRPGL